MTALQNLAFGLSVVFEPGNLLLVLLGVLAGTIIGMLPGLGPITAIALLIPTTFGMEPASALILLAGVYYGAVFGGSTSSILLNAPGISGTVATSFDGYPMARAGKAGKALAIAAIASFVGGTFALLCLALIAPLLGAVAVSFGPAEYFALMVLGLTAVTSLSEGRLTKGLMAATFGVMVSIVGIDQQTGTLRYTFGRPELYEGVDFLVVVLGVFALAEVLRLALQRGENRQQSVGSLRLGRAELREIAPATGRGSVVGFFTGVLPGAGATVGSFLGYGLEKRIAKDRRSFGRGNPRGLAAPEAANNAAAVGSFVPLLTLGVPGSGTTAVLLGALLVVGIQPGPMMFAERPEVFWGVIASMYVGNIVLLILNLPLIPLLARILRTPRPLLLPLIVVFCVIGVYAVSFSTFDLWLLLLFGIIGFLMRANGFPAAPLILGLILGDIMEVSMRRALQISSGDWSVFLTKPISASLLALATVSLVVPPLLARRAARRATRHPVETDREPVP
ncbi:tripartite tricarboxylate transporter permease [Egicoccus sp. AB-alg2]|uniref:tripartite tricarboxylate transporter permease n=1 Tax=Egicoccus sp. AB-alg2 TaxID=3242693 RepID=UPI00359E0219